VINFIIGEKVLRKSNLFCCIKPFVTSLTLYCLKELYVLYLNLYIHLQPKTLCWDREAMLHTLLIMRVLISFSMILIHLGCLMTSL